MYFLFYFNNSVNKCHAFGIYKLHKNKSWDFKTHFDRKFKIKGL